MVDISGTGTANSSGALVFIPSFNGVSVAQSFVLCVLLCRLLFVLFSLFIGHCIVYPAIYVFEYIFDIFKLFLPNTRSKIPVHWNSE
jgi:hypothetical protein